jgi:hypothetical protein
LNEDFVAGRISLDEFRERIERTLRAENGRQLGAVRADLPGGIRARLLAGVEAASTLLAEVAGSWRAPRVPRLALPTGSGELTLGRSRQCDCVVSDHSVSRRHATVTWTGRSWLIHDLSSLNGTRVNGWRIAEEVEVFPGDHVSFGAARYRVAMPR